MEPDYTAESLRSPRQERRWAPGALRMVAYIAALTVSFLALVFGTSAGGSRRLVFLFGFPVLVILFAWLARRSRVAARDAIQSDATLAGAWVVRNAWWAVPAVVIPPVILGFSAILFIMWT